MDIIGLRDKAAKAAAKLKEYEAAQAGLKRDEQELAEAINAEAASYAEYRDVFDRRRKLAAKVREAKVLLGIPVRAKREACDPELPERE